MSIETNLPEDEQEKETSRFARFRAAASGNVARLNPKIKRPLFFVGLGVLGLLLLLLWPHHSTTKASQEIPTPQAEKSMNWQVAQTLQNDLAKLKQRTHFSAPVNPPGRVLAPQPPQLSKQTQIRMSLPGTVYLSPDLKAGNAATKSDTMIATRLVHPKYTVVAGEVIQATLANAINSQIPGLLRARVTRAVYGYTGTHVLIPAGSLLIGEYTSAVRQGMNRLYMVWHRLVLPNGVSITLDSPGTNALGVAGLGADAVNTHFWHRFGEAALISVLSAGSAVVGVGTGDRLNSLSQYRAGVSQSLSQAAGQSLQGSLPTGPTLMIHQGKLINVMVKHDLDFYSQLAA